jgi:hypothetical protein
MSQAVYAADLELTPIREEFPQLPHENELC